MSLENVHKTYKKRCFYYKKTKKWNPKQRVTPTTLYYIKCLCLS